VTEAAARAGAPSGTAGWGALLVGFGNPLRGDDGVARHAVESLPPACIPAGTRVLSCHQLAPELAHDVAGSARVVFVDAQASGVPGRVRVRRVREEAAAPSAFTHHFEPGHLLHLARLLLGAGPREGWIITISGGEFGHGEGLSPRVAAAVPRVHRLLGRLLGGLPTDRRTRPVSPDSRLAR
jgi:hydrogenase maturation protease